MTTTERVEYETPAFVSCVECGAESVTGAVCGPCLTARENDVN